MEKVTGIGGLFFRTIQRAIRLSSGNRPGETLRTKLPPTSIISSRKLVDRIPKLLHRPISGIDADQTEVRMVEVQHSVDGDRYDRGV